MKTSSLIRTGMAALTLCLGTTAAHAVTWSDTYIGYRFGTQFHEPANPKKVQKNVIQFTHASGYSLGQNFVNLDVLMSDHNDPANGGDSGATEFYLTYRHQLHASKVLGKAMAFGPVKDMALSLGADLNTKNTAFAPRKRLLLLGPTFKFDVPGFLDVSLFYAREWNHCGLNAPVCKRNSILFDPYLLFNVSWGIPFNAGSVPMKFQGFLNYATEKGKDYGYVDTAAETLMRTSLMVDVGQMATGTKNVFWMGVGYELWRNKFGNENYGNGREKPGIDTNAMTFQAELHF